MGATIIVFTALRFPRATDMIPTAAAPNMRYAQLINFEPRDTRFYSVFRRKPRSLASIVLPERKADNRPKTQNARNYLKLRAVLVAGVGFEPTTFRL
jgi:hypothetical protein